MALIYLHTVSSWSQEVIPVQHDGRIASPLFWTYSQSFLHDSGSPGSLPDASGHPSSLSFAHPAEQESVSGGWIGRRGGGSPYPPEHAMEARRRTMLGSARSFFT